MEYLSEEKLVIVGAAGMIGSNMAQTALMMRLTPNICLYDPYAPALEGVAEELYQCAFEGARITWTTDVAEALRGAAYIVNSGGAARKAGMTREDLLKGNAQIAEQFGKDVRQYCPDVKHVVVVFNPADITGLITLLYSGLKPSQVSTLAALDSTRLQDDRPLTKLIGSDELSIGDWEQMKLNVVQGGKRIIELRGRSSFQSSAYLSVEMIAAAMGGKPFRWPVGVYVNDDRYHHVMMAMETTLDASGVHYRNVEGTKEEQEALDSSYRHLCKLRDEVIAMGVLPPVADWHRLNHNID